MLPFQKNELEALLVLLEDMRPEEVEQGAPVSGAELLIQSCDDAGKGAGDVRSGFKIFLFFAFKGCGN